MTQPEINQPRKYIEPQPDQPQRPKHPFVSLDLNKRFSPIPFVESSLPIYSQGPLTAIDGTIISLWSSAPKVPDYSYGLRSIYRVALKEFFKRFFDSLGDTVGDLISEPLDVFIIQLVSRIWKS